MRTERQTDRRNDLTKIIIAFRKLFANAPKSDRNQPHDPHMRDRQNIHPAIWFSNVLLYASCSAVSSASHCTAHGTQRHIICSILNCFFDLTEYITEKEGVTRTKVITYTEITLGMDYFLAWNSYITRTECEQAYSSHGTSNASRCFCKQ